MPRDRGQQVLGVAERRDDLMPAVFEEPRQALPQEHLVLRDHYSHGSSAVRTVPWSGLLSIASVPPWAAARSASPRSPAAPVWCGATDPVVGDRDRERSVQALRAQRDLPGR